MGRSVVIVATALAVVLAGVAMGDPMEWPTSGGGNGHFYEAILVTSGISWYSANSAAQATGGYLATIHSWAENLFVYNLVSGNPDFWFIDGANNTQGPWLGGYQLSGSPEPGGGWSWVTGEPWGTYTHWSPGEPNNTGGNEDGLQFFAVGTNPTDRSFWNDVRRQNNILGYIVEYDPVAPTITSHPVSQTACVGDSVTFNVTATGTPPLHYQWRKDGICIAGANSTSYTINWVTESWAGGYACEVTNAVGNVFSNTAFLTVEVAPSITSDPSNTSTCEGGAVSFSVTAGGTAPLTYQWRKDGVPIGGANNSTYLIDPVLAGHEGDYDVVVSNACGSVTSQTATLTVFTAPKILEEPDHVIACEGESAVFQVVAVGNPILHYQWYHNDLPIPGATDWRYGIEQVNPEHAGYYWCVVANECGEVHTRQVSLTLGEAPVIHEHPECQRVCEGEEARFVVTVTGTPNPEYQWRKDEEPIPGATDNEYTIASAELEDIGGYDVLVTNECGEELSHRADLRVDLSPRGDVDRDCDIDLRDYRVFEQCLSGPYVPPPPPPPPPLRQLDRVDCIIEFDFDDDHDVDLDDFGIFQGIFTGSL
ncbi:MAG: immunoglobulin domain-containing protein [Phycisphaerae bacterium]|nr:immunoglobulin domain-containing protein [Phycisphaerae bacterium]